MMRSLRVRLLLLLGAEIIVAAVIQFATSYGAARHEANKLFDLSVTLDLRSSAFEVFRA